MIDKSDLAAQRDRAIAVFEEVVLSFGEAARSEFLQDLPMRMSVWHAFLDDPEGVHGLLVSPNDRISLRAAVAEMKASTDDAMQVIPKDQRPEGGIPMIAIRNYVRVKAGMDLCLSGILTCSVWFRRYIAKRGATKSSASPLAQWQASLVTVGEAETLGEMQAAFQAAPHKPLWRFLAGWGLIKVVGDWMRELDWPAAKARFGWAAAGGNAPTPMELRMLRYAYIELGASALLSATGRTGYGDLAGEEAAEIVGRVKLVLEKFGDEIAALAKVAEKHAQGDDPEEAAVAFIDLNRDVELAISRSRRAIKVDAVEQVFQCDTSGLAWAVIDSGVDARHPAFADRSQDDAVDPEAAIGFERSRVVATYDFNRLTRLFEGDVAGLVSETAATAIIARAKPDNLADDDAIIRALYQMNAPRRPRRLSEVNLKDRIEDDVFRGRIQNYAGDVRRRITNGEQVDWALLGPLLRMPHEEDFYEPPGHLHGSHVAGTIGANLPVGAMLSPDGEINEEAHMGMCPDIRLYDLRVTDGAGRGDEFLTIAALQFVEHLNRMQDRIAVPGVNVSLQIQHLARDAGCGQTPVCREANALVASGVAVVVAAGNRGYARLRTDTGYVDNYAWSSIADPGNAARVMTVGATHGDRPFNHGISYFSSRGPTGDGRQKPDLVAPGEGITAPAPGPRLVSQNGTSMAAPHVSGAAALLLARYPEFIGQPERVKEILCATATDLGRREEFQGRGLVDALRALQSV